VFIWTILGIHQFGMVYIAHFRKPIMASGSNGVCGEAAGWSDLDLAHDGQSAAHEARVSSLLHPHPVSIER
jgi:hypothetical protein